MTVLDRRVCVFVWDVCTELDRIDCCHVSMAASVMAIDSGMGIQEAKHDVYV